MLKTEETSKYIAKLPRGIIGATIFVSIAPLILQLTFFNFGNPSIHHIEDSVLDNVSVRSLIFEEYIGFFVHLILEWSGVTIALSTAALSFIQYKMTGNTTAPIIGIVLFFAGCMDAFHTLAAANIIESIAFNDNFIPFTWTLSRIFNAAILLLGIALVINYNDVILKYRKNHIMWVICFIVFIITYGIVHYCAVASALPNTYYPNFWISRPYDIIPLVLYVILFTILIPTLKRKDPGVFVEALLWSMLPAIATQIHMAVGSDRLFDEHFNIAHFLKSISYVIPFIGIIMDYMYMYQLDHIRMEEMEKAQKVLQGKNKELEQFAFITSHDLQEPLRTISSFSDLLQEQDLSQLDKESKRFIYYIGQASKRMSMLIHGLLEYSRLGKNRELKKVNINEILSHVQDDMQVVIEETNTIIEYVDLPVVYGYPLELRLLFQNLISNAIKFRKPTEAPFIKISSAHIDGEWMFGIQDNGVGIDEKFRQKIFIIFQRLTSKSDGEGTGIGLAHCQKIINLHHGQIWVESEVGVGSTFYFTINTEEE
ncbi:ATP-binding protein [Flammeovirga sp. EKP202]|uniref:ATP-binding protein n=1 Tax=Flammeovirga sp. EKP202 TaxID=2770592 RepID=UPI00165F2FA8|nr:ATP-binding protein [Flammeovirga sp. EKP202]MBD0403141.1 GHKL domain-containing protein [Flammeovirga sp. EKP202]